MLPDTYNSPTCWWVPWLYLQTCSHQVISTLLCEHQNHKLILESIDTCHQPILGWGLAIYILKRVTGD